MSESARTGPDPLLSAALEDVGDRWSLLIVAGLLEGPARFGDLQAALGGIAPNVLTQRLRRLQEAGLLGAELYSRRPPRMVYALTDAGRELAGPLRMLTDWESRRRGLGEGTRHEVCGTPLEARWWCPTCERAVEDPGDELHRL
ncbi:MAG: helix-turn-helix domain-containing protein [Thermoleophilia bacterium]